MIDIVHHCNASITTVTYVHHYSYRQDVANNIFARDVDHFSNMLDGDHYSC